MPGFSLAIIQPSEESTAFPFLLARPYRSGAKAFGIWKAAQNFIAELMTQKGSVRFDPFYGSRLPGEVRGRNVVALGDIQAVLIGAIDDVMVNIRQRIRPADDPEEIVDSVMIGDMIQDHDRVIVHLQLMTEAGDRLDIPLPLEIL